MAGEDQALAEAYSSAPAGRIWVQALELRNETFDAPVRVVCDDQSWDLTLEGDAPADGGQAVAFSAMSFGLQEPDVNKDAPGAIELRLDNVSQTIGQLLMRPLATRYPIDATYRIFVLDLAASPPGQVGAGPAGRPWHFQVSRVRIRDRVATALCQAPDFASILVSTLKYTRERFPTLATLT